MFDKRTAIRLAEIMLEINDKDWKTSVMLASYYVNSGCERDDSYRNYAGGEPDLQVLRGNARYEHLINP